MLGWHISVYRQRNGGSAPTPFGAPHGARLVVWQTGLSGLDWLDDLAVQGKAIDLGGDGYPKEYTAFAAYIIAQLLDGPPGANRTWTLSAGSIVLDGCRRKTLR